MDARGDLEATEMNDGELPASAFGQGNKVVWNSRREQESLVTALVQTEEGIGAEVPEYHVMIGDDMQVGGPVASWTSRNGNIGRCSS
jgi:hypothetical protein